MKKQDHAQPNRVTTEVSKNDVIDVQNFEAPQNETVERSFRLTFAHIALIFFGLICLVFIGFISAARSIQIYAVTPNLNAPDQLLQQDANISLHSAIKLPLGNRILVLPGNHEISLTAPGYQSIDQVLEVKGDRHQQFEIVMTRLPGKLQIELPDGVVASATFQKEVDGQKSTLRQEQISGDAIELPAGRFDVEIDADLYRPFITSVVIQGKGELQSLATELEPAWAEYNLASQPVGAKIIVDGVEKAVTPSIVKVEEGTRQLTIQAPGFKPYEREISVVAQQAVDVPPIELVPADGVIELVSNPSGAAVVLNKKFKGITPLSLTVTPNQKQNLQIYKAGYRLDQRSFSLEPDQRQSETVALSVDAIEVRVSVSPSDAVVYVDGVNKGAGSRTLTLSSLPHKVSVRKAGYVAQENEIIPTRASEQVLSFRLLTQEQHYWAQVPNTYTNRFGHQMKLFKQLGKVSLGSSRREDGRRANETVYQAELTKPFYVALHETTNKQFREFKKSHNAGNYKGKSLDANKGPAVNVSWQHAAQYCNWLSIREGLDPFYQTTSGFVSGVIPDANGYRLLTEAEWAWLARNKGEGLLTYPWGNQKTVPSGQKIGNFADLKASDLITFTLENYDDGFRGPAPVGRFPANHRGLYDLTGNAAEWVNDWYSAKGSSELVKTGIVRDPLGPDNGELHVVRGASWARGYLPQLRLAYRDSGAKGSHDIGFRVARYAGLNKASKSSVAKN